MYDPDLIIYDTELFNSGRLDEWLQLRKKQHASRPDDSETKYLLAEALVANRLGQEALKHLHELHEEDPEDEDVNQLIVDSLIILEREPNSFNWITKPVIHKLDNILSTIIVQEISDARSKSRDFDDIVAGLMRTGLLAFTESELLTYLKTRPEFRLKENTTSEYELKQTKPDHNKRP